MQYALYASNIVKYALYVSDIVCLSDPCENLGTCGVTVADVHQFECSCIIGKNGTQCEHRE